jgi:hypothetical protein
LFLLSSVVDRHFAGRLQGDHLGTSEVRESAESGRKVRRGPRLRQASFKDHRQIAWLESRYGLVSKNYDEWSHLWLGNPVYKEIQPDWSIGWVLEDHDHRIVGSMGNIPLLYEFEGKRILAASGRHWVAEPSYRSASLILLDMVVNQRHVHLYLNNTVSATAAAALDVFGCPRVPVGVWDESGFWITHYQGFSERYLTWKNYPLAKPLSYLLAAGAFFKDRLTKTGLRESDIEVTPCSGFDERFDDFWEDFKRNHPHRLLAVRSREMLEWHYKHALLDNRLWIMTVVDGGRLVAYAIFERKDKPELGLKRTLVVDFQSLDGSTALLSPLLCRAARQCRDEGIHVLEHIGRWLENEERSETIAPYRRRLSAWSYVYRANDPMLAESLKDHRVWAPSLFDGDASLCGGVVMRTHSATP